MTQLPGLTGLRIFLVSLPVVLALAGMAPGVADSGVPRPTQAMQSPLAPVAAEVVAPEFPAGTAESSASTSVSMSADSHAKKAAAVNGRHKDLTVFFSIGVVIDGLLVTAFLVWAVGQWRKRNK